jgi:acyl-coenzyme A thioesterase 13
MSTTEDVPAGFVRQPRRSNFIELIGPLYLKDDERGLVLGLRVREEHLNLRGWVHGAVASALLDVVCARSVAGRTDPPTPVVTASLTVDFIAPARAGDWIEASASVTRLGRRLAFCTGKLDCGEKTIAQATAVFAVVTPIG